MIENDHQLERAYDLVGQLIRSREQAMKEPLWHESLQREVADGIEAQRRKIEREIADYLAAKLLSQPPPTPATTK